MQHDKDNKRRATEHVYRRLRQEISRLDPQVAVAAGRGPPSATSNNGIPTVRATKPGDELKPYMQTDAALLKNSDSIPSPPDLKFREEGQSVRQFRLTRELSLSSRDAAATRSNKPRSLLRPHLPTFVERNEEYLRHDPRVHAKEPKDRIVPGPQNHKEATKELQNSPGQQPNTVKELRPFIQSQKERPKTGRSIRDSPSIWDLESDQLADELAALAVEMDPSIVPHRVPQPEVPEPSQQEDAGRMVVDGQEDYVFETYIRVIEEQDKRIELNSTVGYLVIDEDDVELWNQYINEDDEDEDDWNEEDEDSNGKMKQYNAIRIRRY